MSSFLSETHVDVVIAGRSDGPRALEREVALLNGRNVTCPQFRVIRAHGVGLDFIDERLQHCDVADARHVKTIHISPN